jgi:TP901 family phage tail tape measure protein
MANKNLSAVITIGGAVSNSLIGSLGKTKGKIDQVGGALRNLENQQKLLSRAIDTFGRQGRNVDTMRAKYAAVSQQVDKLRAAQERLLAVERARTANQERQSQLRGQIGQTAVVGAAIALPSIAAFKAASQFNYDLQVIGNTANLTQDQIRGLGMDMLRLSDRTGQSADTLKNATGFLVAAGQDVDTAKANIEAIGRTATATASDIQDVAKASFTLGDSLKVNPSQMQKALDILVQSGKEGNFEFKAMAAELPVLAGSFQALKLTGTEAVATLGAALQIARKGAGSEGEAANNLNNFLAKVLSPDTLKKAEKLGSDLYGTITQAQQRGGNPIEAAIKEIDRITKGGDQKLLGELFGDMQVQNFVRPMLQNLEEYDRIKKTALSADGVTDQDFAKMMATSKVATDDLLNSFKGLAITVGDAVTPAFGAVASVLTPVVRVVRDFVAANPNLVGGLIVAAGAFTTLRLAVLSTKLAFTMLGGQLINVQGLMAKARASAALTGAALPSVAAGVRAIGLALSSTPIGLIVGGIAVGALVIRKYWDPIVAWFGGAIEGMATGFEPLTSALSGLYDSLGFLKPAFDLVGGALKTAWEWFTSLLEPVSYSSEQLKAAGDSGRSFGEALAAGIQLALFPLTKLIEGITWVSQNIGAALASVQNFTAGAGEKIGGAWKATKEFFGAGDEATPEGVAAAATTAPLPAPAMAGASAGSQQVTDSSQTTIQVYQQPGQDPRQLAEEITKIQEQRRAVRGRGVLYDGAMAP